MPSPLPIRPAYQTGIVAPGPSLGRFLFFHLLADDAPEAAVAALAELDADDDIVVGLGGSPSENYYAVSILFIKSEDLSKLP